MKNVVKKVMSVVLLLALTVTLNSGIVGSFPQYDNGGIAPLSDMPGPTDFQY